VQGRRRVQGRAPERLARQRRRRRDGPPPPATGEAKASPQGLREILEISQVFVPAARLLVDLQIGQADSHSDDLVFPQEQLRREIGDIEAESTSWAFNNCENSLKSGGSRIVAIENLPHLFQRLEAFLGRSLRPVLLLIALGIERTDREGGPVDPGRGEGLAHTKIIPEEPRRNRSVSATPQPLDSRLAPL
jgi:hypothetical protein